MSNKIEFGGRTLADSLGYCTSGSPGRGDTAVDNTFALHYSLINRPYRVGE